MQFKHTYDVKFIKKFIPNYRLGFCGSNDVNFITTELVKVFLYCILKWMHFIKAGNNAIRSRPK